MPKKDFLQTQMIVDVFGYQRLERALVACDPSDHVFPILWVQR